MPWYAWLAIGGAAVVAITAWLRRGTGVDVALAQADERQAHREDERKEHEKAESKARGDRPDADVVRDLLKPR